MIDACSWDRPGQSPFTGDRIQAIADYDLPTPVRLELTAKMRKHAYDDVTDITAQSIKGKSEYEDLRMMHFGAKSICRTVTRNWDVTAKERGLVYCAGSTCVIVPTVCGNVALVTRVDPKKAEARPPIEVTGGAGPIVVVDAPAVDAPAPTPSFEQAAAAPIIPDQPTYRAEPLGLPQWQTGTVVVGYVPKTPVAPVPEPAIWALMLTGLGLMVRRIA